MWSILEKNIIKLQVVGYIHINSLLHSNDKCTCDNIHLLATEAEYFSSMRIDEILTTCRLHGRDVRKCGERKRTQNGLSISHSYHFTIPLNDEGIFENCMSCKSKTHCYFKCRDPTSKERGHILHHVQQVSDVGTYCRGFQKLTKTYRVSCRRGIVSWSGTFSCTLWSICMNTVDSSILWPFYNTPIKASTWTSWNISIFSWISTEKKKKLLPKQHVGDRNALFDLVCDLQLQHATAWHNKQVLQTCVYVPLCSIGLATTTKTYSSPDMVCKNDYYITCM